MNLLHVPVMNRGFGYDLDTSFRTSLGGNSYFTLDTTAIAWMVCDSFYNGLAMQRVEKQYQYKGHAKFVEVARLFGWQKVNDFHRSSNVDYENGVTYATDVDSMLLRMSVNVGWDIRPLFHSWGILPISATTLGNSINAANLRLSAAIYDTLISLQVTRPREQRGLPHLCHQLVGTAAQPHRLYRGEQPRGTLGSL